MGPLSALPASFPAREGAGLRLKEEGRACRRCAGPPYTHLGPGGRRRSPGAPVEWAPARGSSPGACGPSKGREQGLQPFAVPGARPAHCSHTHCCNETPNCWLGRGGRGGMGLGAVAGLFCVDFRKSSYLGEPMGGSGPPPGFVLPAAPLSGTYCAVSHRLLHLILQPPCLTHEKVKALKRFGHKAFQEQKRNLNFLSDPGTIS